MHWSDMSGGTGRGFSVIDFGALFSQLLATSWWLPPVLILAALSKSAWFKPKKGSVPFSLDNLMKYAKRDLSLKIRRHLTFL